MQNDNTIIITGGASGIGLAAATWLLERGRQVLIVDHSAANLANARELLGSHAERARFAELDVTREDAIIDLLATHDRPDAPLSGLVNSAGYGIDTAFLETTTAQLRGILDVNLVGTFVMNREAAKRMVKNGGGSIVNIASVSGMVGNKGRSAYGASKAAVINLTHVMANELAAHHVRVNCVCPGPIATPLAISVHAAGGISQMWPSVLPMKRYGNPEEVAGAIGFFLDDSVSSFVTGQVLSVDGGFITSGLLSNS